MPIMREDKTGLNHLLVDKFTGGLKSQNLYSKVQYDDTECTSAVNVEFYPVGVVAKRSGINQLHTTAWVNSAITHIAQHTNANGNYYLLAFSCASGDGSSAVSASIATINLSAGTVSFTTILPSAGASKWNPTLTNSIVTESFGGSAIAVNGINVPYVWYSVTPGSVFVPETKAPTGAAFIKAYRNTAFLINLANNTSRVQWSAVGDFSIWPVDQYMDLDPNDGDVIIGAEVVGSELIVTKKYKVYAINYIGGIYMYYAEIRVDGFGCGAPKGACVVRGLLEMYGIDNIYSFDGRTLTGVGQKITDVILNINPSHRQFSSTFVYKIKSQSWLSVPYGISEINNVILIHDYDRQNWTVMEAEVASLCPGLLTSDLTYADLILPYNSYSAQIGAISSLSNSEIILGGTYDGHIVQLDTPGMNSDFGSDINGYWRSKWFDMDNPEINKRIVRLTVWVEREGGDYGLTLNIREDWKDDGSTIGDAIVYTDTINLSGSTPVLERRLDFTLQARAFQFEFMTSKKDQPFTIHKFVVDYYDKGKTLVL